MTRKKPTGENTPTPIKETNCGSQTNEVVAWTKKNRRRRGKFRKIGIVEFQETCEESYEQLNEEESRTLIFNDTSRVSAPNGKLFVSWDWRRTEWRLRGWQLCHWQRTDAGTRWTWTTSRSKLKQQKINLNIFNFFCCMRLCDVIIYQKWLRP